MNYDKPMKLDPNCKETCECSMLCRAWFDCVDKKLAEVDAEKEEEIKNED